MTDGAKTILIPVKDLSAAKAVYGRLLGEPAMDQPYYVGWSVAGQQIGLDPNGHNKGMNGPTVYWHVADVKATLAELVEAGAVPAQEVRDVGGGKLVATVTDSDGNTIGILQEP
jgi:predicted enzyme related to lactoylglutathione lyase